MEINIIILLLFFKEDSMDKKSKRFTNHSIKSNYDIENMGKLPYGDALKQSSKLLIKQMKEKLDNVNKKAVDEINKLDMILVQALDKNNPDYIAKVLNKNTDNNDNDSMKDIIQKINNWSV